MDQAVLNTRQEGARAFDRLFDACHHLATQIGTLLLAGTPAMRGKASLRPLRLACRETIDHIKEERAALSRLGCADAHALWHVDRAFTYLNRAVDAMWTDILPDRDTCRASLASAINELRLASATAPGCSMVDLACACCAPARPDLQRKP